MFKKLILTTAISSALAITPVWAGEDMDKDKSMTDQVTTGQQTGQEGATKLEAQPENEQINDRTAAVNENEMGFDDLDRNKDGVLDEEELNELGATAAGQGGTEADDPAKADKRGERMMNRLDADESGDVSKEEYESGHDKMGKGQQTQ
ncbi:EF-hand domain-containing protein [Marinobacter salicampi]|uniref:EF-hand domain-containing protein n=1 Tax=Marinobacter salicampi TaxID=435907 RepID=UPI001408A8D5|nr:EF-hand domain-containing protein [Marinobacter salicampi]